MALLLLLAAASLAWSERNPAWGERSWYGLWALGGLSLAVGVVLVWQGEGHRARLAGLVVLLLLVGQLRSLELLWMLAAWAVGGFAP